MQNQLLHPALPLEGLPAWGCLTEADRDACDRKAARPTTVGLRKAWDSVTVVDFVSDKTSPMWAELHKTTSSVDSKGVVESMFSMI
jgi:hypothetical protein